MCSRAAEDRTIPLSVIADRTKLSVEDVEYLLMKSLSVSFLIIVESCVNILDRLFSFTLLCVLFLAAFYHIVVLTYIFRDMKLCMWLCFWLCFV
jgi:hypothetical protein